MLALQDVPRTEINEMLAHTPLIGRIAESLRESGYPELQNLEVSHAYERILLQGRVQTYFLKQVAQALVLSVPGVTAVENQVDVY